MSLAAPSERNFSLFCDVEFAEMSLREAAQQYGISVVRVQEILEQARAWYEATTPQWVREIDSKLQPIVACRLHEARLQHQSSEAMSAWRASQCEVTIERTLGANELLPGKTVAVKKRSFGETRYLNAASQLSKQRVEAAVRLAEIVERFGEEVAPAQAPAHPRARDAELATEENEPVVVHQPITTEQHATCDDSAISLPLVPNDPVPPVRARKLRRKKERELRRLLAKAR